jgi:hypothetical protein
LETFVNEFPEAILGEVEPTDLAVYADWHADLLEWAIEFRSALGRPLAFLQLDIPWANPAPSSEPMDAVAVYAATQDLRRRHLLGETGIIYNGTPKDATDEAWMNDARGHLVLLEGTLGLHPRQVVFQSWNPNPTHAMPDSSPDALTSLVQFYFSPAVQASIGRGAECGR